ncbi:MAG: gliding motility-associated C-terminal domain-containing protein [Saprospiraceae bacterium]|nr:gliding motility-associated C-terminal domain-containing protein [Saprospiraceae bacterium]
MFKKLVLMLLLLPTMVVAQQRACVFVDWSKHFGGTKNDAANDFQRTADGGFIVAGYSRSADEDLTDNKGGADYWVIKLDSLGVLEWQRNYGGAAIDIATGIVPTSDGGYVVAGGTTSFDGNVFGNQGLEDAWVLKLDGVGNIIWSQTFGGSLNERAESIHPTTDGGFILAGYSESADGDIATNKGEFDYWVFKLDANGALQWQRNLGGSLADFAFDALQTQDGGYLVVGSSISTDGDVNGSNGFYDYWLTKLDPSGDLVWQKNFGGAGEERAYGISLDVSGAYVLGTSNSSDFDVPGNYGSDDFWVIKVDLTGNLMWSKNLGGNFEERGLGLFSKAAGGVLVVGYSSSNNIDLQGNYGSKDGWLLNLDEDGQIIWERNFGGSNDDRLYSVMELAEGGYACAGFSASNDFDLEGNYGQQDVWVIKLTQDSFNISLGNDTLLCAGQGVILDANQTGVTHLWSDGSTNPVLLVSSPGEYWLEVDKEGCKARDSILVEYVSEVPVDLGNDTLLCEGQSLLLDPGIPDAIVFWKNASTDPTFLVSLPGTYWVEVSKAGCEYRDTIQVNFTTVPFDLGEDIALCQGESRTLDIQLDDATYFWQDGSNSPSFSVNTPGLVWLKVTQGACTRTDSVLATIQDGPTDPFPDYGFICEDEGVWFNVKYESGSYQWQDGSTKHNFKAVGPGIYSVSVTVGNCIFEDAIELFPCEQCLYLPNVFSPNGDGINDEFRGFPGCEIEAYRLQVYDRWGNQVFNSGTPDVGWNGEFGGRNALTGAYAFQVEFHYQDGPSLRHQIRTGTVTLLR